jgi:hypothetical protein
MLSLLPFIVYKPVVVVIVVEVTGGGGVPTARNKDIVLLLDSVFSIVIIYILKFS